MARMPGAVWQPKAIGPRALRTKGRGVILHVAVSESTDLFPGPDADWHFYVNRAGVIYQYIDTDYQSWASSEANKNTISVETQGGVTNVNGEPWSDAQVHSLAAICSWAHGDEGVPLVAMTDSLPTSRGIGYHKLGIDPWRVAGGESWSASYGKECPGAAKIAQVPQIIALAQGGSFEEDELTPDQALMLSHIHTILADGFWGDRTKPPFSQPGQVVNQLARIESALIGGNPPGKNNFHWLDAQNQTRADALLAAVQALATNPGQVDPAVLAGAVVAALPPQMAQQVVDEIKSRL